MIAVMALSIINKHWHILSTDSSLNSAFQNPPLLIKYLEIYQIYWLNPMWSEREKRHSEKDASPVDLVPFVAP